MQPKIIIIGAGLTGLTIAYLLRKRNIDVTILEADAKIGGRIDTITGQKGTTIEMGATWFSAVHKNLIKLLNELDLGYFNQHVEGISLFQTSSFVPPQQFTISPAEEPSFRIIGGTFILIQTLANLLKKESIQLSTKVTGIIESKDKLEINCINTKKYAADIVISTIPPNLLINSVNFSPEQPEDLKIICKKTHTWMGESIKFAVEYGSPFWKEKNFSGSIFSQANIIQEQYDHSGFQNKTFALKGFLNAASAKMTKTEREERVIGQLVNLFGKEAQNYVAYFEKVWSQNELTFVPYETFVLPHQNNGNSIYKNSFLNGKFFIAGTETSSLFGGYMEGAILAAQIMVSNLNMHLK